MKITPKAFSKALISSSFSKDEQEAIIEQLNNLNTKQIEVLYNVLQEDNLSQEKLFQQMDQKKDLVYLKLNKKIDKIDTKKLDDLIKKSNG